MFKNIQFKIILIFFLIGIIIISGLGISFLNSVQLLNFQVENGQVSSEQVELILSTIQERTSITLIIAGVVFAIIGIIAAIALSKYVIYPINKLIKSAEEITEEDKEKVKKSLKNKKKHDMGDLENIFGVMTKKLILWMKLPVMEELIQRIRVIREFHCNGETWKQEMMLNRCIA